MTLNHCTHIALPYVAKARTPDKLLVREALPPMKYFIFVHQPVINSNLWRVDSDTKLQNM